jgi:UDP-N-acetylglucosamine acyltransferase
VTHQFTTVGAYAMIGMGAVVTKDVPPFEVWVGNPARRIGFNVVGMKRAGFVDELIALLTTEGATSRWHEAWARDAGRRGK